MEAAAAEATAKVAAGLAVLREGQAHQVSLVAAYRQQLETLASHRGVAVEALGAATARLHAAVDAKHAALLAEVQAAYNTKVAGIEVGLAAARAAAGELATVASAAEAGLGAAASAVMRVHVAGSVAASMGVARNRCGVDAALTTLGFEGLSEEEVGAAVRLGRVVTGSESGAPTASACQVGGGMCAYVDVSVPVSCGCGFACVCACFLLYVGMCMCLCVIVYVHVLSLGL
jgi:hypothetical protein